MLVIKFSRCSPQATLHNRFTKRGRAVERPTPIRRPKAAFCMEAGLQFVFRFLLSSIYPYIHLTLDAYPMILANKTHTHTHTPMLLTCFVSILQLITCISKTFRGLGFSEDPAGCQVFADIEWYRKASTRMGGWRLL